MASTSPTGTRQPQPEVYIRPHSPHFGRVSFVETPSPNFNERQLPVTMIVLHYTGMESAEAALARLTDPAAEVSAHYLIDEDGTIHRLVPEDKRAWHAGKSHWRGITDVKQARSIAVK